MPCSITCGSPWPLAAGGVPRNGSPIRTISGYLATLQFQPAEVTDAQQLRADAITRRRTDRLPFEAPAAWPARQLELCRAVIPYDVLLDVVADEQRPNLADARG